MTLHTTNCKFTYSKYVEEVFCTRTDCDKDYRNVLIFPLGKRLSEALMKFVNFSYY